MTLKNRKCYIYALYEVENEYRYIGKALKPEKRFKNHISRSKLKKTYKDNWIQSVILRGDKIHLTILEETCELTWSNKEKYWIKKLKNEGHKLTNHNNGGLGGGPIIYEKPFKEIKEWVKNNLEVSSAREWYKIIKENKLPDFIPRSPKEAYTKRGWLSWGDFLGTNRKWDNNIDYINYNEAKKYIKKNLQNIDSAKSWKEMSKKGKIPRNIPNRPDRYYKNKNRGWDSWGDFLYNGRVANKNKKFFSYNEAKIWISINKPEISSVNKWLAFSKLDKFPNYIPKCPHLTYKEQGWVSWYDFLSKNKN